MRCAFRRFLGPLLLAFCLAAQAQERQQTGMLRIFVVDPARAQIAGATVRLKNERGEQVGETKTSATQPTVFNKLGPGKYSLEVEAPNFKARSSAVEVKHGVNDLTIELEIAELKERVEVQPDAVERALDPKEGALTNFLSREQIDALPDDPQELERVLREIAGQDAVIRVDGFTGGRLPPKSQIASIKIIRSNFDAEFHEAGTPLIDVTTRAGGANWYGSLAGRFNDEALNARYPLAAQRRPSQLKNFDGFISGPIVKNKTSLTLFAFGNDSFDTAEINAFLPGGRFSDGVRRTNRFLYYSVRLIHNLSQTHSLNLSYNGNGVRLEGQGVGGLNLPERAFKTNSSTQQIRFSESGPFGRSLFNEFRSQFTDDLSKSRPTHRSPAVNVLGAFNGGGAGVENNDRRQNLYLADNLLFALGSHAMKIGLLFERESVRRTSADGINGAFTFSSLEDFLRGRPAIFVQRRAASSVAFAQSQLGIFVQDDVRLHKSLSLGFGLRYEWQSVLKDRDNFSPRISLSWALDKRGKVVLRGGAGVFYVWLNSRDYATILSRGSDQPGETIIINPSFPDPFASLSSSPENLPKNFWTIARDLKNPSIGVSSFGVEMRPRRNLMLQALYRFARGVHQFRSRDVNAPIGGRRPNPSFGQIIQIESSAFFARHALEVNVSGGFTPRFSYALSYTLAKEISDADGIFSLPSNSYDLRRDRSVSNLDQRHRFYAFGSWKIRNGLTISVSCRAASPLPYTVTTGKDDNGDAIFNDRPPGVGRNSLRGSWQRQCDANLGWTIYWGERDAADSGTGPRTLILSGSEAAAGTFDVNSKKRFSLRFYAAATNVFNQTNRQSFIGVLTSPLFGQAIAADQPRRVELGMRFSF